MRSHLLVAKRFQYLFCLTVDSVLILVHCIYLLAISSNIIEMCDQQFNIKFVEEVEKHEVLYNYFLPGYSRKDIIEKAWQEVADEVNLPVTECKDKWRNLRTVFIRKQKPHLSKSKRRRKAYYLADSMKFCLPFVKALESIPSDNNLTKTPIPEEIVLKPEKFDDDSASIEEFSERMQSPQYETFSTNRLKMETNLNETAACSSATNIERKEAIKMFLLSLMPEVEDFTNFQMKLFKRKIFSVIDDISGVSFNTNDPLHHTSRVSSVSQVEQG